MNKTIADVDHPPVAPRLKLVRAPSPSLLRQLSRLFDSVGMRSRRPAQMARAIRNSDLAVAAYERDRLVGFGRLVSDHSYYGTLWDVAVERAHQGRGLGHAIVDRLLARARRRQLTMIGLFTTARNDEFYERFKFRKLSDIHPMTCSATAFRKVGHRPGRRRK